MAKKKEVTKPKLTPEQYWKWSNSIAEMWNAQSKETSNQWQLKSMMLEAECASLKAHIFRMKDLEMAKVSKDAAEQN